jgi:hypothetical protein
MKACKRAKVIEYMAANEAAATAVCGSENVPAWLEICHRSYNIQTAVQPDD